MLNKQPIIKEHQLHEKDVGSTEVQVAILTQKINHLTGHMKSHLKDFHSLYGLQKTVGQRKRLLKYLKKQDVNRYQSIISKLGLRK